MDLKEIEGKSQDDVLDEVLKVLVDENGNRKDLIRRKDLTHHTLSLVRASKPMAGEANALFLEGILKHEFALSSSRLILEAEAKGCTHPLLYYYLKHAGHVLLRNEATKAYYPNNLIQRTFFLSSSLFFNQRDRPIIFFLPYGLHAFFISLDCV